MERLVREPPDLPTEEVTFSITRIEMSIQQVLLSDYDHPSPNYSRKDLDHYSENAVDRRVNHVLGLICSFDGIIERWATRSRAVDKMGTHLTEFEAQQRAEVPPASPSTEHALWIEELHFFIRNTAEVDEGYVRSFKRLMDEMTFLLNVNIKPLMATLRKILVPEIIPHNSYALAGPNAAPGPYDHILDIPKEYAPKGVATWLAELAHQYGLERALEANGGDGKSLHPEKKRIVQKAMIYLHAYERMIKDAVASARRQGEKAVASAELYGQWWNMLMQEKENRRNERMGRRHRGSPPEEERDAEYETDPEMMEGMTVLDMGQVGELRGGGGGEAVPGEDGVSSEVTSSEATIGPAGGAAAVVGHDGAVDDKADTTSPAKEQKVKRSDRQDKGPYDGYEHPLTPQGGLPWITDEDIERSKQNMAFGLGWKLG